MAYLVDTNVILRLAQPTDAGHAHAVRAIAALHSQGEQLYLAPQNLIEFWNVATRPLVKNGFGLTHARAATELQGLERLFPLAPDGPAIYPEWRTLVTSLDVSGVQVHDARLGAVMRFHGLTHILTFNTSDFGRYPGITAVHPSHV